MNKQEKKHEVDEDRRSREYVFEFLMLVFLPLKLDLLHSTNLVSAKHINNPRQMIDGFRKNINQIETIYIITISMN